MGNRFSFLFSFWLGVRIVTRIFTIVARKGERVKESVRYGGYVGVGFDRSPVRLTVRDVVSVKSGCDGCEGVGRVRNKGMCILDHLFKVEVILEARPALCESASTVVVGGVGGCVSIFVLHKIKIPPHEEVGDHRNGNFERSELLGTNSETGRAKIDV